MVEKNPVMILFFAPLSLFDPRKSDPTETYGINKKIWHHSDFFSSFSQCPLKWFFFLAIFDDPKCGKMPSKALEILNEATVYTLVGQEKMECVC
jgi:hypothetical protein